MSHDPAAEDMAAGVGVRRHGNDAHGGLHVAGEEMAVVVALVWHG